MNNPSRRKGWHKLWTLIDPCDLSRWQHASGLIARIEIDQSSGVPFARPENADEWLSDSAHVPSAVIRSRLAELLDEARQVFSYKKARNDYNIRKAEKLAR